MIDTKVRYGNPKHITLVDTIVSTKGNCYGVQTRLLFQTSQV